MWVQHFYATALLLIALPFLKTSNGIDPSKLTFPIYEGINQSGPQSRSLLTPRDKVYTIATFTKANWFEAQEICGFNGFSLASIKSEAENKRLQSFVSNYGLDAQKFWLSGTRLAHSDRWLWFNDGHPFTFTNWNAGEPNNSGGQDECVQMEPNSKWNDVSCYSEFYFICETRCPLTSYDVPIISIRR